ncbi:Protein DA1 [Platanthera zijinensis]|uniref:Protein DA1 n=1 Tax=Platanthera zijinensis TaxID=2320716 RepID=A0AAP0C168_9ASPA
MNLIQFFFYSLLQFPIYGDLPYHKSCFRNLYHPKCDVCKEFVSAKHSLLLYIQPQGANYSKLDDRLLICLECSDSSIMDSAMCQPLYGDIIKFYKGLNMDFDLGKIQLLLVESRVFLSEVKKEEFSLCRILTGLNLAHEMMHAWLHLNGCLKLDSRVSEGICVVLSYMWLDNEMRSGSDNNDVSSSSSSSSAPYRKGPRSEFERKFGEYCKYNLENQPYPIYADGFRLGYAAVIKYGLKSVLDHIKLTGNFPS